VRDDRINEKLTILNNKSYNFFKNYKSFKYINNLSKNCSFQF
jgi:hypothetical protein